MLIVPMRWRESMPVAGLVLLAAVVCFPIFARVHDARYVAALIITALALWMGMAWSNWRYRAFDDRFHSQELRGQLTEVSAELAYARRIHESLFPAPIERGPVRVRYHYEPMREIGGDFLYVHPLSFPPTAPKDVSSAISVILIDVSGHGVPAALTVNRLHGEVQRFFLSAQSEAGRTPGALISDLNRFAYQSLAPQGIFATAFCARVDIDANQLRYASAGHPPAYLTHAPEGAGTTPRAVDLPSTATMLGVLPPEAFDADEQVIPIQAGARVVAFTDGVFEASNAQGKALGLERTRSLILSTPMGVTKAVADALKAFRSGRAQDDVLIVEVAT
jgi:serine phosphatase RsbU (regulator of sigma subunit)